MLCNCKPALRGAAQSRIVWRQGDKGEAVSESPVIQRFNIHRPNGDNTMLRFRSAP